MAARRSGAAREAAEAAQVGRLAAGGVWGSLLESYQFGAPARSIIGQLKSRAFGGPRGPRGLLKNASIRIQVGLVCSSCIL